MNLDSLYSELTIPTKAKLALIVLDGLGDLAIVGSFLDIVKSIPTGRADLTRRHDFSDARRGQEPVVDILSLAQKY